MMANKEMVPAHNVISQAYNSTNIDEKLIAKFVCKSVDELREEFAHWDDHYDGLFEKLHKDTQEVYADWIEDKKHRRSIIEQLAAETSNKNKKEEYLREWFQINSEIDMLYAEKTNDLKNYEVKLEAEKAKREKRTLTLQIAKAIVPAAIKCIVLGLSSIAANNNISVVDSTPKITKK